MDNTLAYFYRMSVREELSLVNGIKLFLFFPNFPKNKLECLVSAEAKGACHVQHSSLFA
jgi:hypothetical protein